MDIKQKTGPVLRGGGARAAYQAGVLQAMSRILAEAGRSAMRHPFARYLFPLVMLPGEPSAHRATLPSDPPFEPGHARAPKAPGRKDAHPRRDAVLERFA